MDILFEIQKGNSLTTEFKRVLDEQIQLIEGELHSNKELLFTVHNTRKSFKRIRTTLRLLRNQFPADWFEDQNTFFKELAQEISDMRDAHILLESVELLHEEKSVKLSQFMTQEVIKLVKEKIAELETEIKTEGTLSELSEELKEVDVLDNWPELGNDPVILLDAIQDIYECGYNNMYKAFLNATSEGFHEWRKQVKHLYHIRMLLDQFWPVTANQSVEDLKELSDILGTEHDLAILMYYIIELEEAGQIDNELLARFYTDIETKRRKLQKMADHLGRSIYAESADYYIRHFETNWKASLNKA